MINITPTVENAMMVRKMTSKAPSAGSEIKPSTIIPETR
jgi:hypothetical protein